MAIFGDNSQGAGTAPGSSDRCWVSKYTSPEAGSINSAGAYFSAASTSGSNAKVVIYADSGGTPGALVAASSGAAVPAGGGLVTFTMSGTFSGSTTYWIGVVHDNFQADVSTDTTGATGVDTKRAEGVTYSSPPSWPGTADDYPDLRINAYVDYTASSGTIARLSLLGVG
jgi:hypothetical protein